ncbi:60S ribosomal protein L8-3 [Pyrus ussuriensis x Pyrus communis]|uniref:60S ribosomal protein L8-3 n=1 Tax=Pyrus ussuriensis x Pyrus communis TaxID=2448454 RepID=A0A5N5I6V1_9ROSA|nr:60S ribosomal protein L8-3 [Pyrus ussuriensis x Pyrus communis]
MNPVGHPHGGGNYHILDRLQEYGVTLLLGRRLVSLLLGGLVVSEDKLLQTSKAGK